MSEAVIVQNAGPRTFAGGALKTAAVFWFVVALIGQWAFAAYTAVRYGPTVNGDFAAWHQGGSLIDGYIAEAEWANTHTEEAVDLAAEQAGWSPAIIERYKSYKTQYTISFINDEIVANLQRGADWLTAHAVLPDKITIADHVVQL